MDCNGGIKNENNDFEKSEEMIIAIFQMDTLSYEKTEESVL